MWLEEAHLPDLLSADSRRSDVRPRTRREFEPRIRCVDFVRENCDPHGVNVCHLNIFADEPLHDVEIVNHQVEYDVDVERARGELADAMNLEVNRFADVWSQRNHRGIEALEMSDLKNCVAACGGFDHAIGFVERARDRFFDEDVNAGFE